MLSRRYLDARFWNRRAVLGISLQPYALAHVEALEDINSPFLTNDLLADFRDLVEALLICRTPADQLACRDNWKPRTIRERYYWWASGIYRRRNWILEDLAEARAEFRAYINAHSTEPEFYKNDGGQEIAAPLTLWMESYIAKNTSYTLAEIRTMPKALAVHLVATLIEMTTGKSPVPTQQEQEDDDRMVAAIEAEEARGRTD